MRSRSVLLVLAVLAACRDSTSPPPPDGEIPRGEYRILVERFSRTGRRSFYSMAPDGSMVSPEPGFPENGHTLVPSPNGSTIAWLEETDLGVELWLMDREGGDRRPVLDGDIVVADASWSPDGHRLVVGVSTPTETADIWIADADGTDATNLTPDAGTAVILDRDPDWSPDGEHIAFASNRSGGTRLWIMDADAGNQRQVIPDQVVATEHSPAWSPDGSRLAFVSSGDGGGGIGVVDADGGNRRIFPRSGDAGRLAWSPDGRVMFSDASSGDHEVYLLHPETGVVTPLTAHEDHDYRAVAIRWIAPSAWLGFGAPARHPTGRPEPPGVAIGDLTADALPDIMLLAPSHEEVSILKGTGSGSFQSLGSLTAPGDQRSAAVADVSRDDSGDLIVLGAGAISVWHGSDQGPGVPATRLFEGEGRGFVVHDFDRDGSVDIAAVHERDGELRVMVYSAREDDGELVAVLDYPGEFPDPGRACGGDVTGEGRGDLVVVTGDAATPVVLIPGHGDISFEAPVAAAGRAVTADVNAIPVCADLDGDRRTDLALLRPGAAGGLSILRSTGVAFGAPSTVPVKGTAMIASDVDRDGDVDLLVAGQSQATVLFLRNRGDAQFAAPVPIAVGGAPLRLAAGDVNGDFWDDLVVAHRDGSVAILANRRR